MARIRSIKPEFFRHGGLFDLEQETGLPIRVAFAGLWTASDREGRFQWKPRELKLDCLPHDVVDFSRVLDALRTRGHIVKYAIDGVEYGYIPSWPEHQVINNRETASVLPEPTETSIESATCTRDARVVDASVTPLMHAQGEGKGREGKGREGNVATATAVTDASGKAAKPPSPTSETWKSYADAYENRYGTQPIRNAKVNGQLASLVSRLGAVEAPAVARFYVGFMDPFYVKQMHAVDHLLRDAEKLRTQWATKRTMPEQQNGRYVPTVADLNAKNAEAKRLLGFATPEEIPHA